MFLRQAGGGRIAGHLLARCKLEVYALSSDVPTSGFRLMEQLIHQSFDRFDRRGFHPACPNAMNFVAKGLALDRKLDKPVRADQRFRKIAGAEKKKIGPDDRFGQNVEVGGGEGEVGFLPDMVPIPLPEAVVGPEAGEAVAGEFGE